MRWRGRLRGRGARAPWCWEEMGMAGLLPLHQTDVDHDKSYHLVNLSMNRPNPNRGACCYPARRWGEYAQATTAAATSSSAPHTVSAARLGPPHRRGGGSTRRRSASSSDSTSTSRSLAESCSGSPCAVARGCARPHSLWHALCDDLWARAGGAPHHGICCKCWTWCVACPGGCGMLLRRLRAAQ